MADVKAATLEIAEGIDVSEGSLDFVRTALSHFLAINLESGLMPPFGLIECMELVGLGVVNPERLSLEALVDEMRRTPEFVLSETIEAVLASSATWTTVDYQFMESWFEADAEVSKLFKGKRVPPAKMVDLLMREVLPKRRRRWAERLGWSAYALFDSAFFEDAADLITVARELMGERPLDEIPLMRDIAATTVEAWQAKRR